MPRATLRNAAGFDSLQISIDIADQEAIELVLPAARAKQMGVIAKRPITNVAWKGGHKPADSYHHVYWERLRKLSSPFLRGAEIENSVATALLFTLQIPGVCRAIIGTKNLARWAENAQLLATASLGEADFEAIRERWEEVAPKTWIGQT